MALDFPASPSNGDNYVAPNGVTYVYDSVNGYWYVTPTGAVDTADIADGAVTTPKLADDAVTGAKLASGIDINANNIVLPDNGGVTFGTSASGNGTVTSKVLVDFEQGTFTPSVSLGGSNTGLTYSSLRHGTYTKIGRQVTCFIAIALQNKGSSTGTVRIEDLPFVASDNIPFTSYEGGGHAIYQAGLNGTVVGPLCAGVVNGQSYLDIMDLSTTTAGITTTIDNSDIQDAFSIRFLITYTTNS